MALDKTNNTVHSKHKNKKATRVLVVEDSKVMQELLQHILSSDPAIEIIGTVRNGLEAIEFVNTNKPDIITMDVNMPVMNGLAATREIMETAPVPIIIVSENFNPKDVNDTFKALEAGAVSVVNKPVSYGTDKYNAYAKDLCHKVKLLSEVQVIRRSPLIRKAEAASDVLSDLTPVIAPKDFKVVAIGASTGGPIVLEKILSSLPKGFSLPVVIVQHISKGFISGLADWLNSTSSIPVSVAASGVKVMSGKCYIAPDDSHLRINPGGYIFLSQEPPVHNLRPSVSMFFRSVAESYGSKAIGILLTGMGKDGAEELKMMKSKGALTVAQNKETSVVFGMPGEAVKINAASVVLSPEEIITLLTEAGR